MAAVEGQQRHQVEDADEHVDEDEQLEHLRHAGVGRLRRHPHRAHRREEAVLGAPLGLVGGLARELMAVVAQARGREERAERLPREDREAPQLVRRVPHGTHRPLRHQREVRADAEEADMLTVGVPFRERRRHSQHATAALDHEGDGLPRAMPDVVPKIVPPGNSVPVDGQHLVVEAQAGILCRALAGAEASDGAHVPSVQVRHAERGRQDEEQDEGDDEMGDHPCEHDGEPLRERLVAIGTRLVARVDLLEVVHPDDAAVAAEGERLHPVLGLAPPHGPQPGTESDEELGHLHTGPLGRCEVAGLVQHDHQQDRDDDHHGRERACGNGDRDADRDHQQEAEEVRPLLLSRRGRPGVGRRPIASARLCWPTHPRS